MHKGNGIIKIRFLYYQKYSTHSSLGINIDVKYLKDERETDRDKGVGEPERVKWGLKVILWYLYACYLGW